MAETSRLSRLIATFHNQIVLQAKYITDNSNANGLRLGLTIDDINKWVEFKDTDALHYPIWVDKSMKTKHSTNSLNDNIKKCHEYNKKHKLIDRIAACPLATLTDYAVFNIKNKLAGDASHTIPTEKIKEKVEVSVIYEGGGRIRYECRPDKTSKKSHIPAGSNGIEIRCKIGDPAPIDADNTDVKFSKVSSRAIITMDYTIANIEKHVYVFFRWVDTKRPYRNGAWTTMMRIVIA